MSDIQEFIFASTITIAQVERIAPALEDAFRKSRPVELDGRAVERVDTAALQLIVSFCLDMKSAGVPVTWIGASDYLVKMSRLLGISDLIKL
jgi:ABC-type transporter Mla MlaB component